MSYDKIKSISFKDNKVFITSTCNNIRPLHFNRCEATYLTHLLQEKGKNEVLKVILKEFWSGNFQGRSTIYGKFIEIFNLSKKYTWDNTKEEEDVGKVIHGEKILYSYEELKEVLLKEFFDYKEKCSRKNLYIVEVDLVNYITKLTAKKANLSRYKSAAKKFTMAQVEDIKTKFTQCPVRAIAI